MGITVEELMTTRVVTLTPEMTLKEMDTLLVKRGVSGAPVVERGRLVGVASQADVVRTLWEGEHEAAKIAAYYSSPYLVSMPALEKIAHDSHLVNERLVARKVRDIMTKDPLVAHPDDDVATTAARMLADQIHRFPVTHRETGELLGIFTALDLAKAISRYGLGSGG
ncbi:MAG: CBS domain-containing protein [Spirochaetaceae bacterium]|nr:CBS domain-containing protein [Spirochaetaceae bacterium]